ncbi:MAG: CLI_3235 family bacteriocin precursor [Roseburia faecis]|nr:CLI_3235 family bacteriocin precursor [Roseburia faecis]
MKKLGKKAKAHENSLSAYCSSACTCLTITCTCSSTSHDPTGNYMQGEVKATSAGTIVWL